MDTSQVQPRTVITEGHGDIVALLREAHHNGALRRLARGHARSCRLNAMPHGIAQQVLKRRRHAVKHTPVNFKRTALKVELDRLVGIFGGLPHHAIQALRDAVKFDHAGTQQVALQLAGLARLGNQIVFNAGHGLLQVALQGGHVVHRLGHHAGEFLHPGKAVKLKRVKTLV